MSDKLGMVEAWAAIGLKGNPVLGSITPNKDRAKGFARAFPQLDRALDVKRVRVTVIEDAEVKISLLREFKILRDAVRTLMAESTGVTGLHLNGDVAPWTELDSGGKFEGWLGSALDEADAAITKAESA